MTSGLRYGIANSVSGIIAQGGAKRSQLLTWKYPPLPWLMSSIAGKKYSPRELMQEEVSLP
jgi:hypothetical protein